MVSHQPAEDRALGAGCWVQLPPSSGWGADGRPWPPLVGSWVPGEEVEPGEPPQAGAFCPLAGGVTLPSVIQVSLTIQTKA